MSTTSALPALALAAFLASGLAGRAEAAPAEGQAVTRVAETSAVVRPVSATEGEDDANCSRIRRRLWVEGEGWIVRRITTCR